MTGGSVDGISGGDVTAWFAEHVPEAVPPLGFRRITGGRSNLTFDVRDAEGRGYVLRRPPLHMVLPSAHDVAREYRIMAALEPTDVPVPRMRGLCQDEAVNGADFFVSDFVEGMVPQSASQVEERFDAAGARELGLEYPRLLARLHEVDPDAVGLGELGRRDDYLGRQLRRWSGQWDKSKTRELALVDELARRITDAAPPQQGSAIVHGDYRPDNTIVSADGRVVAVLDWELSTLGDPLADLGALMCYWVEAGEPPVHGLPGATSAHGSPTRVEVAEEYARVSGRDIGALDIYLGFAYWRLAVILEGVLARYRGGAMGQSDDAVEEMDAAVVRLAAAADASLGRAGA
jgi:aminoglycoside phosphotransferase (APT) family kinase protein